MQKFFNVIFRTCVLSLLTSTVWATESSNAYSCQSSTKLGYAVSWEGAQSGSAKGQRGGRYWAFIGETIYFYLQTPFRESLGELWFAHTKTDINYAPGNEYRLVLGPKKTPLDHGTLQLNQPWFEGRTRIDAGEIRFETKALRPTDEPCIVGEGEVLFTDENNQSITVTLQFALDVTGRKYRK